MSTNKAFLEQIINEFRGIRVGDKIPKEKIVTVISPTHLYNKRTTIYGQSFTI